MSAIKSLFWGNNDKRLRAGWRLLVQLLVLMGLMLGGILILGIVSGIFAVSAAMPATAEAMSPTSSAIIAVIVTVAMTASLWIMGRFVDKRPLVAYGLRLNGQWWVDFAFGAALGVALMALIFGVQWALGWVTIERMFANSAGYSFAVGFALVTVNFIGVGIYEEMLSRGYHLLNLAEGFSFLGERTALLLAWGASSAVFGLLHANNPNATLLSTLNITIAGIMLGLPFVLTRSLAIPIGLHITWNLAQGNIFGFPVSGTRLNSTTVIEIVQGGPDLWTGGRFGPEAGLFGLLAMALGIVAIIVWTRSQHGEARLQDTMATYQKPKADV